MQNNKCLYCYQSLDEPEGDFHQHCSKKFFGTSIPPVLDYSLNEMHELAKKVIKSKVTVPGVQAKISIHFEPKKGAPHRFTLVGLWGNYILKPPTKQYANLPENESLTMHMAELLKINTVPHSLIRLKSGELAFITKRVDRLDNGKKLPMEDLCQLSERLTEDKYKGSMEQVGKTILQFSSNRILDLLTFFEVTLFSFLTGNADMHLKNFSLMETETGLFSYSPTYDLLSTRLVISEKDDPEEMALMLDGRKRKFTRKNFQSFAANLGLNEKQVENVFVKFKNAVPMLQEWIDNSFLPLEKMEEYKKIIVERSERIFNLLVDDL